MRRYIVGVPLAVAVSLGLFYLMRFLISGEVTPPEEEVGPGEIDITREKRPEDIETISDVERPVESPPPDMPKIDPSDGAPDDESIAINMDDINPIDVELGDPSQANTDVQPIVRIEPQYPFKAEERNIEGWVIVRFTVTETGTVEGAEVIRCVENEVEKDPSRCVFKSESEKAVNRWKYQPRMEGGNPMRWDQEVLLSFDLAE